MGWVFTIIQQTVRIRVVTRESPKSYPSTRGSYLEQAAHQVHIVSPLPTSLFPAPCSEVPAPKSLLPKNPKLCT
ncbi:MAG: hypothetical protein F6K50_42885 [Moorea sp. SIO3I7]|nr:hypothetical protein [Moorena sp. SIO3I7]